MRAYAKFHSTCEKRFLGHTVAAGTNAEDSSRAAWCALPSPQRRTIHRQAADPATGDEQPESCVRAARGSRLRRQRRGRARRAGRPWPEPSCSIPKPGEARARDPAFGKLREPVLRLTAFLRAFNATSDSGRYLVGITDDAGISLGQSPLRALGLQLLPPGLRAPGHGPRRGGPRGARDADHACCIRVASWCIHAVRRSLRRRPGTVWTTRPRDVTCRWTSRQNWRSRSTRMSSSSA